MLVTALMFLVILFLPRLIVVLTEKIKPFGTFGPVFLCYAAGLLLSFVFRPLGADLTLASDFSSVLVCVGMPLILFSADLPALKKLAKPMLFSYGMNVLASVVVAIAAFFLFRAAVPRAESISGMLVGVYVGGTPNMIAVGNAMGAPAEQIMLVQTADMIAGGIYFFLLLSVLPRLLKRFLPEYQYVGTGAGKDEALRYAGEFSGKKQKIKPLRAFISRAAMVLLALLCFAAAAGICLLLPSRYGNTGLAKLSEYTAVIMLTVTTLGIALSFIPRVRSAHGSYSSGQYFLLMFSVVMGLSFDLSAIGSALTLLVMVLLVQFGTVLLHLLLAKLGKIDSHTMLITSTAGIFGPPFIIPVANALGNDEIILPGILCGILGLAIGNYLGLGVGELLRLF
ncbi:MAG TPA: DUF819 family protein [Feifaniaceae bacterium]|nr:DUF819 family protein [Feifaniaceae bacterium]